MKVIKLTQQNRIIKSASQNKIIRVEGVVSIARAFGGATYSIKTADYLLTNDDAFNPSEGNYDAKVIYMNSDSEILTATLPANPNDEDIQTIKNIGSMDVIIDRNGKNIEASAANHTLSKFSHPTAKLQYTNSLGWFLI